MRPYLEAIFFFRSLISDALHPARVLPKYSVDLIRDFLLIIFLDKKKRVR